MLAWTRKLASFLNACLLSLVFCFLLIATNVFISRTVNAASCQTLTEETCSSESHAKRKRAIYEFAGRCMKPEMASSPPDLKSGTFEGQYFRYIRALERRLLPRPMRLQKFFAEVKSGLIRAIDREPRLTEAKKREYRRRVNRTTLLLPSDHVAIGGSSEFRKTCGELGLEENASFVVFGSGETHVMVCPGRLAAAVTDSKICGDRLNIDVESLLYTFAHELGHSVGGNFAEFNPEKAQWTVKDDPVFQPFHQCMKGRFAQFPQQDYGEAAADYWASQVMAGILKSAPNAEGLAKRALAGLCGTQLTARHLPGEVRIERLIAGQKGFQVAMGCEVREMGSCGL